MFDGTSKFPLGRLLATPGALATLEEAGQTPLEFIARHARGDWGDVCADDKQANEDALVDGSRLLSSYKTSNGEKLWIITEAQDDNGCRAASTILRPDEY
ncbi:MAG: hypothetical protein GXX96_35640 [Planctomycetaceae bacterium]|nr:hypothetical protein [Planctomycetaceae bacterium]